MLNEVMFSVSLSLSVKSRLMLFNCNSVVSLLSIPGGGLLEFFQLIVLD